MDFFLIYLEGSLIIKTSSNRSDGIRPFGELVTLKHRNKQTNTETYGDVELLQSEELMIHLYGPEQLLRAVHQLQGACDTKTEINHNFLVWFLRFHSLLSVESRSET